MEDFCTQKSSYFYHKILSKTQKLCTFLTSADFKAFLYVNPLIDFNNSNSKVPELNVNDELVIPESESIAEMPETSKNVLRRRQSAPVNQEPPTSSARSLRPKRSIRNESFNFLSLKC